MARALRRNKGFSEAQAQFAGPAALSTIFGAFGYRCAFTGGDLRAEAGADPLGWLLRLAPSGPPIPGNVLPACADAIYAYERGNLGIGSRFELLVALDRIDPQIPRTPEPHRSADPADRPGLPSRRRPVEGASRRVRRRFHRVAG